ncbi:hypothetical protein BH20CHL6_BH20CHL6_18890 [soil metagenome]
MAPMTASEGAVAFPDESTALLEGTPRVFRALLCSLPEGWLGEPDTAGGWTARDVVGHLTSADLEDWIRRAAWQN